MYVSDKYLFPIGGSGVRRHARYIHISEICPISGGMPSYCYTSLSLPCKRMSNGVTAGLVGVCVSKRLHRKVLAQFSMDHNRTR